MKKVLSTALALGLVAGIATTAAAYDSFSITGYYALEGNYVTNYDRTSGITPTGAKDVHSSWYEQDFRVYPTLKVNDKISVMGEVRFSEGDWGKTDALATGSNDIDLHKIYMDYISPVGKIRVGTVPWGAFGPAFLSSTNNAANAILWWPNMLPKPFTALVKIKKTTEQDSSNYATTAASSDEDNDFYEAILGYKADNLSGEIALNNTDNQTNPGTSVDQWVLRGHAKMTAGDSFVEAEFAQEFGDSQAAGSSAVDYEGLGLYAHAGTKMNNMSVGIMGWYLSGDENGNTDGDEAIGQAGNDFNPLLIATGDDYGLLNGENTSDPISAAAAGQLAVGAYVSMPVSDKMTLTTVIGAAWADEEKAADSTQTEDFYGWEIDIKMDYKLLDNLTYSVNFGYFDIGDYVEDLVGGPANLYEDDIMVVQHTLNMTF